MGRKVICRITGDEGTTDDFVKINGKYYKSQKIYDEYKADQEFRSKIIKVISNEFLGYEHGQKFPSFITKSLKDLSFYSNKVIYKTLMDSYNTIARAIRNKNFNSDWQKSNYIFAIITNRINDIYKREKEFENSKAHMEREECDNMAELLNSTPQPETVQKKDSISDFLEGED